MVTSRLAEKLNSRRLVEMVSTHLKGSPPQRRLMPTALSNLSCRQYMIQEFYCVFAGERPACIGSRCLPEHVFQSVCDLLMPTARNPLVLSSSASESICSPFDAVCPQQPVTASPCAAKWFRHSVHATKMAHGLQWPLGGHHMCATPSSAWTSSASMQSR